MAAGTDQAGIHLADLSHRGSSTDRLELDGRVGFDGDSSFLAPAVSWKTRQSLSPAALGLVHGLVAGRERSR
jgi:hypothetical protein